jgi:hypothetical protein
MVTLQEASSFPSESFVGRRVIAKFGWRLLSGVGAEFRVNMQFQAIYRPIFDCLAANRGDILDLHARLVSGG